MQTVKRHSVNEILAQARATFAPLSCELIWSEYRYRLGFRIQDQQSGRTVRFIPMALNMLEQDSQLWQILNGIRAQLLMKGFPLPE